MDIQPWERLLWAVAKAARDAEADVAPDYTFSFARQRPTEIKGLYSKDMGIVRAPKRSAETHPYACGHKCIDHYPLFDECYPEITGREVFDGVYPQDLIEDDPAFDLHDQVHHDTTDHGETGYQFLSDPTPRRLSYASYQRVSHNRYRRVK